MWIRYLISRAAAEIGIVHVRTTHQPRLATVSKDTFAPVFAAELFELFINVLDHQVGDALDCQVGHETDGKFALDRAGNDGLAAGRGCTLVLFRSTDIAARRISPVIHMMDPTWSPSGTLRFSPVSRGCDIWGRTYRKHPRYRASSTMGSSSSPST